MSQTSGMTSTSKKKLSYDEVVAKEAKLVSDLESVTSNIHERVSLLVIFLLLFSRKSLVGLL